MHIFNKVPKSFVESFEKQKLSQLEIWAHERARYAHDVLCDKTRSDGVLKLLI